MLTIDVSWQLSSPMALGMWNLLATDAHRTCTLRPSPTTPPSLPHLHPHPLSSSRVRPHPSAPPSPSPHLKPFRPKCQALSPTPPAYGNSTSFGHSAHSVVYGTPKAKRSMFGNVSVPVCPLFPSLSSFNIPLTFATRPSSADTAIPGSEVCHHRPFASDCPCVLTQI